VPGEHDIYDGGAQFRTRFGKNTAGAGWYSFDQKGVHFVGLVNVANIQEGGLGTLGQEQLDWLEKDVKSLSASTPIVLFAHIPLWAVYPGGQRTNLLLSKLCSLPRSGRRWGRGRPQPSQAPD
jgi:3',5'-cyclic-AMP phosphodiesterase